MKADIVLETCNSILNQMRLKGFSENSVNFYSYVYQTLKEYLTGNRIDEFTDQVRDNFLADIYEINISDFSYLSKHKQKRLRAIILIEKYSTEADLPVLLQYKKVNKTLPAIFLDVSQKYKEFMEEEGFAFATRKQRKRRSELLLNYLLDQNVMDFNGISLGLLYDFIRKTEGCSNRTTNLYILILNDFLRFLYLTGFMSTDLSHNIPTIMKRDEHLPSVWKQDELKSYLEAIDRSTKIGKRDYALSLLAIRLGLRGSDIRNLKFNDIDWNKHVISICQVKTKELLVLPLPEDVGWAIIDYIKNSRPETDFKNIFVRMTPPFTPYGYYCFQSMIDKYCHIAGIARDNMKNGLHSFRHSLATQLMTDQVPVQVIRSILGHKSLETVNEYLKVNINLLRECSLSPEVIYE